MEADYSSKLISDSENLPDDGKRKKAVVQQAITMPQIQSYGGFEYIKAAVSFCFDDPCTVFWHGGFRREPPCNVNYIDRIRQE